jgi:hypothetical protein
MEEIIEQKMRASVGVIRPPKKTIVGRRRQSSVEEDSRSAVKQNFSKFNLFKVK